MAKSTLSAHPRIAGAEFFGRAAFVRVPGLGGPYPVQVLQAGGARRISAGDRLFQRLGYRVERDPFGV